MTMGRRIKKLRESANMSQADFGAIVGVSDKAVSTWENDLKVPRMGKIQKLADYFGVSKSYIIDGKEETTLPGDRVVQIPMEYKKLTGEDKEMVDSLIIRLANKKAQA